MDTLSNFGFDSKLDARQLHSRQTLSQLANCQSELCSIRFDALLVDGALQPHADLYFHLPETGRLVPALALPIDLATNRLVWPDAFADWPDALLAQTSRHVLDLWSGRPAVGQVIANGSFQSVFGAPTEQLLNGRSIPGLENYWTTAQVLNRYQWVERLVQNGCVLEVATGPGFGAAWLLERQAGVNGYVGVDLDDLAIGLARRLNPPNRARFHLGLLETLPDTGFDWVLSLETIEHTPDPERFLMELKHRLAPGGRMLVSLPCERWHGFHLNPHHWSAWNFRRIRTFLEPHFGQIDFWRQGRPRFNEHALDGTGRITPLQGIDADWDEDYLMLLSEPREAPRRSRVVVQRRYARGDVLQATPIVRAIRDKFPDHTLVVSTDIDEAFAGNPHVDLLMATSSGFRPRADDLVINLDEAYERQPKQHILAAYAAAAGVPLPNPTLELHLDRRDYQIVGSLLEQSGDAWQSVSRLVAVHMGATPDRSWPFTYWQVLIAALNADPHVGIVVVGAGADFHPAAAVRVLDLVGRLDLRETAAAVAIADVLVGPDSALLHVAAAVGTPAVGLYGMADPRLRIPFGADQAAVRSPVDCAGCLHELPAPNNNPRCKFSKSFCMEAIAPAPVITATLQKLGHRPTDSWRARLQLGGFTRLSMESVSPCWAETATAITLPPPASSPTLTSTDVLKISAAPDALTPSWLPQGRFLPSEKICADEAIAAWKASNQSLPVVALALMSHSRRLSQTTKNSLQAQWMTCELLLAVTHQMDGDNLVADVNPILVSSNADWIGLIDAGDELAPDATFRLAQSIQNHPEWQIIYTDEDSLTAEGEHVNPHCKPDFNLDYLRSLPYVGGLMLIKKTLFDALGGFDPQADGAEDYDFLLRAWERIGDEGIGHIPEVLYHRRQGSGHCNKSIEEILAAGREALQRHFERLQIPAEVQPGPFPPSTRVRYPLSATPLVSIVIPTRNQLGFLQRCIESLIEKTQYPAYEVLIIDNDSDDAEARTYLDMLTAQEESMGGRLRVLRYPGAFNFSAMNNMAVDAAHGEYILLLNNDTAALHEDWLDEMVSHALRPEVGIVGAKLLYPDGKIQHAGVILGMKGPAEHPFIGHLPEDRGYFGRAMLTQNYSAVTGACLLISKALYQEVGGLDEQQFRVSYNDIDLCLRVREAGHKIVWTPWAMLLHEGSASQKGAVEQKADKDKLARFAAEKEAFYKRWLPQLAFDPAYNRHLSLASTDFLLEDQSALTWDPEWRPRPRILVHPADREGCGEYRIISPMRALRAAGKVQGWETMRIFEPAEMERFSPDSIVLQRQMEWPQIEALERHKRLHKAFRVFEIDDLITNLPVKSVHKGQIHKDIAKRFRKAAGLCDRLVVATEPLAQAYKGFSDEVRVQPNCVERAVWGDLLPRRRGGARPRVGWAGGVGHTGDLELVADVVRDLANAVEWVFFGLCPEALRPYVHEFHPGVPLPQYPAKLASLDLDLAIAPLEENPFNDAKSHLRILEYGVLGFPVVCSNITPYQGDFPVWRVANRYRDWMKTIREAISDRAALAAAGDALRDQVRARWMLEDRLDDWLQAWLP